MVKSKTYHVEEQGHTKQGKSEGKKDVAEWMKLKGHGMLGGGSDDEADQAAVTGKAQGSKYGKQQLALQDKASSNEDGEAEPSCEAPRPRRRSSRMGRQQWQKKFLSLRRLQRRAPRSR